MKTENATFYCFKESGKYYTHERGILTREVYLSKTNHDARSRVLFDNGGNYPGLSFKGQDLIWFIIPDEEVEYGYPLCLPLP